MEELGNEGKEEYGVNEGNEGNYGNEGMRGMGGKGN